MQITVFPKKINVGKVKIYIKLIEKLLHVRKVSFALFDAKE